MRRPEQKEKRCKRNSKRSKENQVWGKPQKKEKENFLNRSACPLEKWCKRAQVRWGLKRDWTWLLGTLYTAVELVTCLNPPACEVSLRQGLCAWCLVYFLLYSRCSKDVDEQVNYGQPNNTVLRWEKRLRELCVNRWITFGSKGRETWE